jgi:phosphatidylglycerol:prolipoprotein diacylglycerol transferase
MILLTFALIIGARLFEVFIYNPSYYLQNPAQIIAVWKGGLSFHGGLIGVIIAGYLFARKKKIKFLHLCDIFVVPLALAQVLGRIGNFINGELYGTITRLPWGMKFPGAEGFRHPSQLYEAAYNLVIFSFLFIKRNKKQPAGYLLSYFLILYPIFRFFTEFVREPEVMIGFLTMGQVLNIGMFIGGIGLFYWIKKKILSK